MRRRVEIILTCLALTSISLPRLGAGAATACCSHVTTLEPCGGRPGGHFSLVAVSGEILVVGAPEDTVNGIKSGSACVFRRQNGSWVFEQLLLPGDPQEDGEFGLPAVFGNEIVVAGPHYDNFAGAVYVFRYDPASATWRQEAKLAVAGTNQLGSSFAFMSEDRFAAASFGAVVIFRRVDGNWQQDGPALASGTPRFGVSVAACGNVLVVGDDENSTAGPGRVHVYEEIGGVWTPRTTLLPSDGVPGDLFGFAVACSQTTVVAGAYQQNSGRPGAVYVFERRGDDWSMFKQVAKLTAFDGAVGDFLGVSVSFDGKRILSGAPFHGGVGAAYLFVRPDDGWQDGNQSCKLMAPNPVQGDRFGESHGVALSGQEAFVAAPRSGGGTGSMHVFSCPLESRFLRGDVNANGTVDLSDGISTLFCLFRARACGRCHDAADSNDNGRVDVGDPIFLFMYLFRDGPEPPPPGTSRCGRDPTDDALDCQSYSPCS